MLVRLSLVMEIYNIYICTYMSHDGMYKSKFSYLSVTRVKTASKGEQTLISYVTEEDNRAFQISLRPGKGVNLFQFC